MELRPHQQIDLDRIRAEVRAGRDPLLVAPCGYGKGFLISLIVKRSVEAGKRIIFSVHGKSLVHDMSQRVKRLGIDHGILIGGKKRDYRHKVQVASIDTLHRMEFPPEADYVIIDEAHMSGSPTWRKAIARYPNARLIGMTATPVRLDGKGLGRKSGGLFDTMIIGPSEVDLIALDYLVRSRVFVGSSPALGKSELKSDKQVAAACDKTTLIGDLVANWQKHAGGRKTAAFGVDQAHARHIADSFIAAGFPWAYVDADTPETDRQEIWRQLKDETGNLMGVASCGTIGVGWDCPIVSCLVMARPTASLALWKQQLGRGSRPYPGKDCFIVLDHAGNTSRHAPYGRFEDPVEWSLDGDAVKESDGETGPQVTKCWGAPVSVTVPDDEGLFEGATKIIRKFPCGQDFRSGPRECPFCGYPLPVKAREVQVIASEMKELEPGAGPLWAPGETGIVNVEERRRFLFQMLGVAKKREMRSPRSWVTDLFRRKFAAEPPRHWFPVEMR